MKVSTETGIGLTVVNLNASWAAKEVIEKSGYDSLHFLLYYVEEKLKEAGIPLEFVDVEQNQPHIPTDAWVGGIRFTMELDGKHIG